MVTWSCEFDLYLSLLFSLSGLQTQIQAIWFLAPDEGTGGGEGDGGEGTGGEGVIGAGDGGVGATG